MGVYSFFIGWTIIILLFWGSTRFEGTRTITYYALWLAIVLAIVTHYNTLRDLITSAVPIQDTAEQGSAQ